jgi:hypothetical protein
MGAAGERLGTAEGVRDQGVGARLVESRSPRSGSLVGGCSRDAHTPIREGYVRQLSLPAGLPHVLTIMGAGPGRGRAEPGAQAGFAVACVM